MCCDVWLSHLIRFSFSQVLDFLFSSVNQESKMFDFGPIFKGVKLVCRHLSKCSLTAGLTFKQPSFKLKTFESTYYCVWGRNLGGTGSSMLSDCSAWGDLYTRLLAYTSHFDGTIYENCIKTKKVCSIFVHETLVTPKVASDFPPLGSVGERWEVTLFGFFDGFVP